MIFASSEKETGKENVRMLKKSRISKFLPTNIGRLLNTVFQFQQSFAVNRRVISSHCNWHTLANFSHQLRVKHRHQKRLWNKLSEARHCRWLNRSKSARSINLSSQTYRKRLRYWLRGGNGGIRQTDGSISEVSSRMLGNISRGDTFDGKRYRSYDKFAKEINV